MQTSNYYDNVTGPLCRQLQKKEHFFWTPFNYVDLPLISIDISLGRDKKTTINIFYREFTNGMYGLSDSKSQLERLERQINHWRLLFSTGWDVFSDYSW